MLLPLSISHFNKNELDSHVIDSNKKDRIHRIIYTVAKMS